MSVRGDDPGRHHQHGDERQHDERARAGRARAEPADSDGRRHAHDEQGVPEVGVLPDQGAQLRPAGRGARQHQAGHDPVGAVEGALHPAERRGHHDRLDQTVGVQPGQVLDEQRPAVGAEHGGRGHGGGAQVPAVRIEVERPVQRPGESKHYVGLPPT
ncbi:hypothetical protein [Streptomyces galbus]|uniref:hypothetical protein n=1 Tax=Streptomyces galbus TaxID=33898 RepID=UPI003EBE22CC